MVVDVAQSLHSHLAVWAVTWNLNGRGTSALVQQEVADTIHQWLPPAQNLVVLSFPEFTPLQLNLRSFFTVVLDRAAPEAYALQRCLGNLPNLQGAKSLQPFKLGALVVLIFERLPGLFKVDSEFIPMGLLGPNKGAICAAIRMPRRRPVTIVGVHLEAGEHRRTTRLAQLKCIAKVLRRSGLDAGVILMAGDFNFRPQVEESLRKSLAQEVALNTTTLSELWPTLWRRDEAPKAVTSLSMWLGIEMRERTYASPEPPFPPTYKMQNKGPAGSYQSTRVPAWTDRILVSSDATTIVYRAGDHSCRFSDHLPVFAQLQVNVSQL